MKQKKLNLKEIKNALSRNEMKKIMAGSGPCGHGGDGCGGNTGRVCCYPFHCSGFGGSQGVCVYP